MMSLILTDDEKELDSKTSHKWTDIEEWVKKVCN